MFSYRHGFHAGAHSDVLKHLTLIAVLKHMVQKETALVAIDTHAGAGLYRLDGDFAEKSGEAEDGIFKLFSYFPTPVSRESLSPALVDYLDLIQTFNPNGLLKIYPGSPFVIQKFLRASARDRLKLFELHPNDSRALAGNIRQLNAGRQISVAHQDGFDGLMALLPPPSRRALILIDPSYEIKSDYAKVANCIKQSMSKFPTGTYIVWYPIIPRLEATDLPRKLRTIARLSGKNFLNATLSIGQSAARLSVAGESTKRPGLTASGLFIVNPPHTLKASLEATLPQVLEVLRRSQSASVSLVSG